jgi:hypothetical protein
VTATQVSVPVPAETGGEDRLAGSLTFRHAAYLAVAAAGVAVMLLGERSPVRVVAGTLLALLGVAGAVCRPYGEPLDRLVPAALGYLRRRRAERCDATVDAEPPDVVPAAPDPPEVDKPPTRTPTPMRRRLPLRPLAAVIAVAAVLAVAVARWPQPAPPERSPRVVVVTVPVPAPDPWEEAIDDAVDSWLDDVLGT